MKLLPMTEYTLWLRGMTTSELCRELPNEFKMPVWRGDQNQMVKDMLAIDAIKWRLVGEHAKLLVKELKPEMFIPLDKNGLLMEDPELSMAQGDGFTYYRADDEDFVEYERAMSKVIFKDAKVIYDTLVNINSFSLQVNGIQIGYYKSKPDYWIWDYKKIEDIAKFKLEMV